MESNELERLATSVKVDLGLSPLLRKVVLVAIFLSAPALSQTFCALTVNIEGYDGKQRATTWVHLVDPEGRVEKRELVRGPSLRICDFGFGAHAIIVAPNECYPITISNLHLELGHPITLNVRTNKCEGEGAHTGCKAFFRVLDRDGNGIAGAAVSAENGRAWPMKTDEFGRVETLLAGGERRATILAEGYQSRSITLKCGEGEDINKEIVLEAR